MIAGGRLLAHRSLGSGPPLVLIHGLSGSGRWWNRNLHELAREHRVYTVDLAGFGASRRCGPFRLEKAVAQLVDWMDAADIARASLVGHSLGGLIALMAAAQRPERVDRLVLVDAAVLAFDPGLRNRVQGVAKAIRFISPEIVPLMVSDALRCGPFAFADATRDLLLAELPDYLATIEAPALVIWGEHDTVVPRTVGEALVERLPNARLAVIAGASHNPMWDRPDAFNQLVLDFLRENISADADRTSRCDADPAGATP